MQSPETRAPDTTPTAAAGSLPVEVREDATARPSGLVAALAQLLLARARAAVAANCRGQDAREQNEA
jgi:hypothetical protein